MLHGGGSRSYQSATQTTELKQTPTQVLSLIRRPGKGSLWPDGLVPTSGYAQTKDATATQGNRAYLVQTAVPPQQTDMYTHTHAHPHMHNFSPLKSVA